jgi:hypothetical protein
MMATLIAATELLTNQFAQEPSSRAIGVSLIRSF